MKLQKPPDGYGQSICLLCKHIYRDGSERLCNQNCKKYKWNAIEGIYIVTNNTSKPSCYSLNHNGECKNFSLYLTLNMIQRIKRFFNLYFNIQYP